VTQQGIVIFALQLLLIVLIPVLDDGERLVPLSYAASSLAVATLTVPGHSTSCSSAASTKSATARPPVAARFGGGGGLDRLLPFHFEAKLDGFANFYHEFVERRAIGVTPWQLGYRGNVQSLFIPLK
jgi:hypothetical protein